MQRVLEKLQILLARVVRQIGFFDHVDQRFADVDRIDAIAGGVVRERIVQGLHDEARRDAVHAFALGGFAQFLDVDFFGASLLDDLFAVVELQLGHEIALVGRLEARQDREHRSDFQRMRRHVRAEIGVADDLLVNLHFFGEAQIVGHADHHDAVQNRFVGVVGLEFLPLGFVGVGDDDGVDVDQSMAAWRRHDLFLGRRDHAVEIFDLVLENLDEFHHAAVADVERAVQLQDARIAFRI